MISFYPTDRAHHRWKECEERIVKAHFKCYMCDENKGFPGKKEIEAFLKDNPSLTHISCQTIKTKVMNERAKAQSKGEEAFKKCKLFT